MQVGQYEVYTQHQTNLAISRATKEVREEMKLLKKQIKRLEELLGMTEESRQIALYKQIVTSGH